MMVNMSNAVNTTAMNVSNLRSVDIIVPFYWYGKGPEQSDPD